MSIFLVFLVFFLFFFYCFLWLLCFSFFFEGLRGKGSCEVARRATSLGPKPSLFVFLVCFFLVPFLSLFSIEKTLFSLKKGIFCLFLSVSLSFSIAFFGLPLFHFSFSLSLSLSRKAMGPSSFWSEPTHRPAPSLGPHALSVCLPSGSSQDACNRLPEAQRGSLPGYRRQHTHLHLQLWGPLPDDEQRKVVEARSDSASHFRNQWAQPISREANHRRVKSIFFPFGMLMRLDLSLEALTRAERKDAHIAIEVLPGSGQDMHISRSNRPIPAGRRGNILIEPYVGCSSLLGCRIPTRQHGGFCNVVPNAIMSRSHNVLAAGICMMSCSVQWALTTSPLRWQPSLTMGIGWCLRHAKSRSHHVLNALIRKVQGWLGRPASELCPHERLGSNSLIMHIPLVFSLSLSLSLFFFPFLLPSCLSFLPSFGFLFLSLSFFWFLLCFCFMKGTTSKYSITKFLFIKSFSFLLVSPLLFSFKSPFLIFAFFLLLSFAFFQHQCFSSNKCKFKEHQFWVKRGVAT